MCPGMLTAMEEPQSQLQQWMLFGKPDVVVDRDGRVEEHIICRSCGYDLISIHKGQQCPECGAPVAISIGGDLLAWSQPDWTAHVGRHVRIGGLMLMLFPVVMVIGVVIAIVSSRPVSGILPTIVLLPWCYCIVRATRPDPAKPDSSRQEQVIRIGAGALAGTIVFGFVLASMGISPPGLAVFALASISFMTTLTTYHLWLSELILRVPSNDICDTIRQWLWVVFALMAFIVIMVLAQGVLGVLFLAFFLAVPGWLFCVVRLGYCCVVAGEIMLCESRLARTNWLEREALLDKEQRFAQIPADSVDVAAPAPEPVMDHPKSPRDDGNDTTRAH
jgi:hypothetical protein